MGRPKAGRYLVQYTSPEQGFFNEVTASSLKEANDIVDELADSGKGQGFRIINSDDVRIPRQRRKSGGKNVK